MNAVKAGPTVARSVWTQIQPSIARSTRAIAPQHDQVLYARVAQGGGKKLKGRVLERDLTPDGIRLTLRTASAL